MFRFAQPGWFLLLPLLAAAAYMIYRPRVNKALRFPGAATIMTGGTSWRALAGFILPALFLIALAGLIAALARPQQVQSLTTDTTHAIAIQMAIDISRSMEALDMSTQSAGGRFIPKSRLDAVKEVFTDFVGKRPDDLIGLVTFAGYATTLAPLTSDHEALSHVIADLTSMEHMRRQYGAIMSQEEVLTAIGDGLATACARIQNAQPKSKVVVLLTDGVSNTGLIDPREAMHAAEQMGIKVYTIGVGTQGEATIPVRTRSGNYVLSRQYMELDEPLLREIANRTGGEYFNVRDPQGLKHAIDRIDEMERTEIERKSYHDITELFPRILLPSLFLACMTLLLNKFLTRRFL